MPQLLPPENTHTWGLEEGPFPPKSKEAFEKVNGGRGTEERAATWSGTVAEGAGSHGGCESGSWVVFLPCYQMSCGCLFTTTVVIIPDAKGILKIHRKAEGPWDLRGLEVQVSANTKCGSGMGMLCTSLSHLRWSLCRLDVIMALIISCGKRANIYSFSVWDGAAQQNAIQRWECVSELSPHGAEHLKCS